MSGFGFTESPHKVGDRVMFTHAARSRSKGDIAPEPGEVCTIIDEAIVDMTTSLTGHLVLRPSDGKGCIIWLDEMAVEQPTVVRVSWYNGDGELMDETFGPFFNGDLATRWADSQVRWFDQFDPRGSYMHVERVSPAVDFNDRDALVESTEHKAEVIQLRPNKRHEQVPPYSS